VSDEDGATSYRAVKYHLLESYNENVSTFDHQRNHHHGGNHRHGESLRVALSKDDKSNITSYNCNKVGHHVLQSRHVLARLRPDMYFKMPKCQNVGESEVGDPKLATRKDTKIGEIVDYRRWGSAVGTPPPLSYSSVAHFLPSD
jgi:hypothetical protein